MFKVGDRVVWHISEDTQLLGTLTDKTHTGLENGWRFMPDIDDGLSPNLVFESEISLLA